MDQNFVCDSLSKENSVFIKEIIQTDSDKIAIIKYNIDEYVIGDFNNSIGGLLGMKNDENISMRISHSATGHFSITNGKWISYHGIMEIESNASMFGGKTITEFKLIE